MTGPGTNAPGANAPGTNVPGTNAPGAGNGTGIGTTTLVVTNDFPPRIGGIESFVASACRLLDNDVVVLTSRADGWQHHDRGLPHPVVRLPTRTLLPTRAVARAAIHLAEEYGCDRVLFGAAAPLGLLAPQLRARGVTRIVGLTHGHEVWWARVPGTRHLLRRIATEVDVLGYISGFTGTRIGAALRPVDRDKLVRLPPPVNLDQFDVDQFDLDQFDLDQFDLDQFAPAAADVAHGTPMRVVAAGRLVPRKGWTVLLEAWQQVQSRLSRRDDGTRAVLEIIGSGPLGGWIRTRAKRFPPGTVLVRDAVPHDQMPAMLSGARAFALPVRTPWPGLQPEGLGVSFVEAAACGIPVLVGDSGGAADTVDHGRSGWLLDPDDVTAWADHLEKLITDPQLARDMGDHGRREVAPRFGAVVVGDALRQALGLTPSGR